MESWEDRERKKPSSILSGTCPRLLLHAESPHHRLSVRREAGGALFGPALSAQHCWTRGGLRGRNSGRNRCHPTLRAEDE